MNEWWEVREKWTYVECTSPDSLCRLLEVAILFGPSRDGVFFATKAYVAKGTRRAVAF